MFFLFLLFVCFFIHWLSFSCYFFFHSLFMLVFWSLIDFFVFVLFIVLVFLYFVSFCIRYNMGLFDLSAFFLFVSSVVVFFLNFYTFNRSIACFCLLFLIFYPLLLVCRLIWGFLIFPFPYFYLSFFLLCLCGCVRSVVRSSTRDGASFDVQSLGQLDLIYSFPLFPFLNFLSFYFH